MDRETRPHSQVFYLITLDEQKINPSLLPFTIFPFLHYSSIPNLVFGAVGIVSSTNSIAVSGGIMAVLFLPQISPNLSVSVSLSLLDKARFLILGTEHTCWQCFIKHQFLCTNISREPGLGSAAFVHFVTVFLKPRSDLTGVSHGTQALLTYQ